MAIKLEVGKKYELNNGEVHECELMNGYDPLAVNVYGLGPFVINGLLYHQDGTFAYRSATQEYYGVKCFVDDVKPEPVRETVTLYGTAKAPWLQSRLKCDTHCITFDVIDGVPDCDSIKMEKLP